jgi:hypothetical protein
MGKNKREVLRYFARKYIWWKTPEESLASSRRILAQVMNLGDWEDVTLMIQEMGMEALGHVLRHAESGEFTPRSWNYWHLILGLAEMDHVPPLPQRRFSSTTRHL